MPRAGSHECCYVCLCDIAQGLDAAQVALCPAPCVTLLLLDCVHLSDAAAGDGDAGEGRDSEASFEQVLFLWPEASGGVPVTTHQLLGSRV